MAAGWADGLIRWRPHVDRNGNQRSLAHLHPFRYDLKFEAHSGRPERVVEIQVGFGLHVFTCGLSDADELAYRYADDRENRFFDEARYQASMKLEPIVRDLENRRCYHAKKQNFLTVENIGAPDGTEYRIFFYVRKIDFAKNAIRLIVESAYFGDLDRRPRGQTKQPIGFRAIVGSALAR